MERDVWPAPCQDTLREPASQRPGRYTHFLQSDLVRKRGGGGSRTTRTQSHPVPSNFLIRLPCRGGCSRCLASVQWLRKHKTFISLWKLSCLRMALLGNQGKLGQHQPTVTMVTSACRSGGRDHGAVKCMLLPGPV